MVDNTRKRDDGNYYCYLPTIGFPPVEVVGKKKYGLARKPCGMDRERFDNGERALF